jgi:uncharacterized membrane protein
MRWLRLAVLALALTATAGGALAQDTGGSMGGGDFGGDSGGGGGWSGGDSGGGGFDGLGSSDHDYDTSGRVSGTTSGWSLVLAFGLVGLLLFGIFKLSAWADPMRGLAASPVASEIDVSALRLGIDHRARRQIQDAMRRIAETADTRTKQGLARMLREVAVALRKVRSTWVYAGVTNAEPMSREHAEAFFRAEAARARAEFKHELIRAHDGVKTTADEPADLQPRPEEGIGLVVVTIVVAARVRIVDFHEPDDGEEIRGWLEVMSRIDNMDLAAVEIIWTPAAERDRMSSVELEHRYRGMKKIRGRTGDAVGKTFCAHCSGLFPAELGSCPHCGATVKDAA